MKQMVVDEYWHISLCFQKKVVVTAFPTVQIVVVIIIFFQCP